MTTTFRSSGVWSELRKAARANKHNAHVAVAYFGQGASDLLPIGSGSRLVVDASKATVTSGQTCPAELKKLWDRGVRIYSVPNLHAKVFVLGSRVFVGSANASRRSANSLVEALVETSDRKVVAKTKRFVSDLCLDELGSERLDGLTEIYQPPRMVGRSQRRGKTVARKIQPVIPSVYLARLTIGEPPRGSESSMDQGSEVAETRMLHPRKHEIEVFWWHDKKVPYRTGDIVVQISKETDGRRLVSPPGSVVHIKKWPANRPRVTFIYLEVRAGRRRSLERLGHQIGEGAERRLNWGGRVNQRFAERLLAVWSK